MISYLNKSGIKIKKKLFENFITRGSVVEDSQSSDNSGINFKEYEEDLFYSIEEFNSLSQCSVEQFEQLKIYLEYKSKKIFFLKQIIEEDFLFYKEYMKVEKNKIEGKLNEIKSKIAFLGGFEGSIISSVIEDFNNYNQIDDRENNNLPIDTRSRVLTLPIQNNIAIPIRDIKILSSSNGIPGNILEETNSYLSNSLNDSENLYFEYYKKGSNTLNLNLELSLGREEIINDISIKLKQKYAECNFIIKNMVFIDSDSESIGIHNLIDSSEQDLSIQSYNMDNELKVRFLPVKAVKLKLYLQCSEPSSINDTLYNAIAIREIKLIKNKYLTTGNLTFKEFSLEGTNTSGSILNAKVKRYPKSDALLNWKHVVSFDTEEDFIVQDENLIIEDDYNSVKYKFELEKPTNLENLYNDNNEDKEINLRIKQAPFNREVIPNSFILNSGMEFLDVYQPNIYRRSLDLRKAQRVGVTTEQITRIILPEPLEDFNLTFNKLRVFLNGKLCSSEQDQFLISDLSCFYDGEYLYVRDNSETKNKVIKILFDPEECINVMKEDRIFYKIEGFFDRDLENLNLISFNNETEPHEETVTVSPNYKGYIKLEKEHLKDVSIEGEFTETDGNNYYEDITSLFDTNERLGICLQKDNPPINLIKIKIKYSCLQFKRVTPEKIWVKDNRIVGCSLPSKDINLNSYTQSKNEAIANKSDNFRTVTLNENSEDTVITNTFAMLLKSRNILSGSLHVSLDFFNDEQRPREVSFINGRDEFLNLRFIQKEAVPLMEVDANTGEISFTLRRSPSGNNTIIQIYKNNVEVNVDYAAAGRVLTLNINESTTEGYQISYFTEEILERDNNYIKYSVDYINGILFCEKEIVPNINSSELIKFKSTNSIIESNVCKKIESYTESEGRVSVNFSNASEINNLVKMSWKKKTSKDLEDLIDYYSPIIYQLQYEIRG